MFGEGECPKTISKSGEGIKHDSDKLRMDLLPPEAIFAIAEVLTYGANKYKERNWEKGIDRNRIIAAALRHIFKYMLGESQDSESGISHLKHALTNLVFLVTYEVRGMQ